jgi:hypothetical protein
MWEHPTLDTFIFIASLCPALGMENSRDSNSSTRSVFVDPFSLRTPSTTRQRKNSQLSSQTPFLLARADNNIE